MTKAEVRYEIKKYEGKADKYQEIFNAFGHVDPALMQYTLSYEHPDKEAVELCKIIFAIDKDLSCHALDPIAGPDYRNKNLTSIYAMRTVMPIAFGNLTKNPKYNFASHISVRKNGSFDENFALTENAQEVGGITYYESVKVQTKSANDSKTETPSLDSIAIVPDKVQ